MNVAANRKTTEWEGMDWIHLTENKAVEKDQYTVEFYQNWLIS